MVKWRGALLKVCYGDKVSFIERPLQKIIPLEVLRESNSNDEIDVPGKIISDSNNSTDVEPRTTSDVMKDFDYVNDSNEPTCAKRKRAPPVRGEMVTIINFSISYELQV